MFRKLSTQHVLRQNSKTSTCSNISKNLAKHLNIRLDHSMSKASSNITSNFNVELAWVKPTEEKKLRFADILLWNQSQQQARKNEFNAKNVAPKPIDGQNNISKLVIPEMRIPEDPQIKKKVPISSRPFKIETYVGNCRKTERHIQMSPPKKQIRNIRSSHKIRPVYNKEQDNEIAREQLMNWIRLESEDERIKYFLKKSENMDKQFEDSIEMSKTVNMPQYEFEQRQEE